MPKDLRRTKIREVQFLESLSASNLWASLWPDGARTSRDPAGKMPARRHVTEFVDVGAGDDAFGPRACEDRHWSYGAPDGLRHPPDAPA